MIELCYCINKRISKEEPVKIICWNLLEAFDTVSYNRLLKRQKSTPLGPGFCSKELECAVFLENGKATENRLNGERIKLMNGKKLSVKHSELSGLAQCC